jgi:hypothetical protein
MPSHDDNALVKASGTSKVPMSKGGVVLSNVESVVSSTHENRNQKDKTFTEADAEIGIKKEDRNVLNQVLKLNIDASKTISPSKYIDLANKEINSTVSKYKKLDSDNSGVSKATLAANLAVLESLPTIEDIYDTVFAYQESKKSENQAQPIAQVGGLFPAESLSNRTLITKKMKPKDIDVSDLVNKGEINPADAQKYIDNVLKSKYEGETDNFIIKDNKYNKRNNLPVPKNMLTDIVRAAKVSGVEQTPTDLLALAMRESDLGSGTVNAYSSRSKRPTEIFSNWYGSVEGHVGDNPRAKTILKEVIKYPFANEMLTIKDKTKKFGIRGYNYGDPDYANKVNREKEILNLPENKKLINYADSVYKATPKNFYDLHRFKTGGLMNKYLNRSKVE